MLGGISIQDPFKELASVLTDNAGKQAGKAALGMSPELGTITVTGLKLDRFKHELKDYLMAEYLMMPADFFTTTELNSGAHAQYTGDGRHDHKVITPQQLKPLTPGDRVMALPVNGGQDFVVIARVVPNA